MSTNRIRKGMKNTDSKIASERDIDEFHLNLGRQVSDSINKQFVTTETYIAFLALQKFLKQHKLTWNDLQGNNTKANELLQKLFGKKNTAGLLSHRATTQCIREAADRYMTEKLEYLPNTNSSFNFADNARALATNNYNNHVECGECATAAMVRLLESGCQLPVHIIEIEGQNNNHQFILLASPLPRLRSIDDLYHLSNDVIFIDPFFNIASPGSQLQSELSKKIDLKEFPRVKVVQSVSPHRTIQSEIRRLKEFAEDIADQLSKDNNLDKHILQQESAMAETLKSQPSLDEKNTKYKTNHPKI